MDKYLIITGGSRGIGEKTIAYFLERDWKIINISRTSSKLSDVTNIHIDLSSSHHIQNHLQKLHEITEDALICLVHNAAFYKKDNIDSLSLTDLQATLETNVVSAAALNKIFIPFMLPGSSIIYIGSTLSEKAVPGSASYIISKHAIIGLMRATCQDLANVNIRSCCICPGLVNTKLLNDTLDKKTIDWLINNKIMGKRLIEPEEVAKIIYFVANNPIINGEVIHANLGQFAD